MHRAVIYNILIYQKTTQENTRRKHDDNTAHYALRKQKIKKKTRKEKPAAPVGGRLTERWEMRIRVLIPHIPDLRAENSTSRAFLCCLLPPLLLFLSRPCVDDAPTHAPCGHCLFQKPYVISRTPHAITSVWAPRIPMINRQPDESPSSFTLILSHSLLPPTLLQTLRSLR